MDPKGHAAIVTGAASGLGAETAAALARAGAKVALLDVNLDAAQAQARTVGGLAIRCDVTSSDDAIAALKAAREVHGQGILEPGARVVVEGVADDGTIEAIRIADAPGFALGVQWHAEYDPQKNPINRALFEAFGQALTEHRRAS